MMETSILCSHKSTPSLTARKQLRSSKIIQINHSEKRSLIFSKTVERYLFRKFTIPSPPRQQPPPPTRQGMMMIPIFLRMGRGREGPPHHRRGARVDDSAVCLLRRFRRCRAAFYPSPSCCLRCSPLPEVAWDLLLSSVPCVQSAR